jgi:hypothetical protein
MRRAPSWCPAADRIKRGRDVPDFDDVKKMVDEQDDQVDAGLEKAGDMAESKFGHGEQIDQVVEKAQEATGSDDQQ